MSRATRRLLITLLAAQALVMLAVGMQTVILPWAVLKAGGGAGLAASAWLLTFVAYLVLGVPAGRWGDRSPRRRLVRWGTASAAAGTLLIAAGLSGLAWTWVWVAIGALVLGAARPLVDAGCVGALREIGGEGRLPSLIAWVAAGEITGRLAGAPIAAALIALGGVQAGAWAAAGVAAAGLVASLVIHDALSPPERRSRSAGRLKVALQVPGLRRALLVGVAYNAVATPVALALLVPYAGSTLDLGAVATGVLVAAGGVAALIGTAIMPRLVAAAGPWRAMGVAMVVAAVGLAAVAFAGALGPSLGTGSRLALAIGAVVLYSVAHYLALVGIIAERQRSAPRAVQSIVATTSRAITWAGMIGGALLASALVGPLGIPAVAGLLALATTAVAAWVLVTERVERRRADEDLARVRWTASEAAYGGHRVRAGQMWAAHQRHRVRR
ncbi:MAG: MFS transporter [Thermoleophilia bacterium]|nr:MFS transporter [Thermoleophilia bacterium]